MKGKRIGGGHLRVDAARAVAKLRDYQLPDPLAWVLECFRAAVALGATHVEAWGDADDVWLGWRGPSPDAEELARLLDVLVSPQTRGDRRWARLAAIGVNTALGIDPRFVDVWTVPAEGDAMRVRYTPRLLDDGERLRALAPEAARLPPELAARLVTETGGPLSSGGAFQVRRSFGFDVIGRFMSGRQASELALLLEATRDARVPVVVSGQRVGGRGDASVGDDVLRLPLGDGLDGFVAVTRDGGRRDGILVELAERGAVLARMTMALPALPAPVAGLPLRVYFDAPRLPTNAARSAVREGDAPVRRAIERALERLPALVEALVEPLRVALGSGSEAGSGSASGAGSASGSETGSGSGSASEAGSASEVASGAGSGPGSEAASGAGSGSASETGSGSESGSESGSGAGARAGARAAGPSRPDDTASGSESASGAGGLLHLDDVAPIRLAALRLYAAAVAGSDWVSAQAALPSALAPLRDTPLVLDALGRVRAPGELTPQPIVHVGREPVEAALADWLGDVLWVPPGDPAALLLGDAKVPNAKRSIEDARRQLALREAWLRHEQREPVVDPAPGQVFALTLEDAKLDLRGELVLLDPQGLGLKRRRSGQVTLLVDGRVIGAVDAEASWPWVAVVSARLTPASDYRSPRQDAVFQAVMRALAAAEREAVERLAHHLDRPGDDLPKRMRALGVPPIDALSDAWRAAFRQAMRGHVTDARRRESAARTDDPIGPSLRRHALGRLPVWPTASEDGQLAWRPLRDLPRALRAESKSDPRALRVAFDTLGAPLPRPAALHAEALDRAALESVLPQMQWVDYDPRRGEPLASAQLARRVVSAGDLALAIDDAEAGRRCVVALTQRDPELLRFHRGERVERVPLPHPSSNHGGNVTRNLRLRLLRCVIAIDDDRLVPETNATGSATGVAFESPIPLEVPKLERALLDALVDALGGAPTALLGGPTTIERFPWVRDAILVALAEAPLSSLDTARRAKARAFPLVPLADGSFATLEELREERGALVFVEPQLAVGDLDWAPVQLPLHVATALGRILGRKITDGREELARRRRALERARREAQLRRWPPEPLPPVQPGEVKLGDVSGVARLASGWRPVTTVQVRVDGHPYERLELRTEAPLELVVDLPLDALGPDLEGLTPDARTSLERAANRAIGPLLVAIAESSPERLLTDAAVLGLLEHWAGKHARKGSRVAAALCRAAAFPSIQGQHVSIDDASTQSRVRVADHEGAWLGPADDEDPHTLDRPVLSLRANAKLRAVIEALAAPRSLLDFTRAARTLQAERRVRHGMVSAPTLPEVPNERKETIRRLLGKQRMPSLLGPGEVALVDETRSQVGVFASGALVGWLPLDIRPSVRVVMEAPALEDEARKSPATTGQRLTEPLRKLTAALLREKVLPNLDRHPRFVRDGVRQAFASGLLDEAEVRGHALFETTSERWLTLEQVRAQEKRFGEVWYTSAQGALDRRREPLAAERFALRLVSAEAQALGAHLTLYDAADKLIREDQARVNLAKPRVKNLLLPPSARPHLMAETTLAVKQPKGVVGLLATPSDLEGLRVHREGVPLGVRSTGFDWPVVAVVEDPRLTPNDVYDDVVDDHNLRRVRKAVEKAAEAALKGRVEALAPAPADALARALLDARHSKVLRGPGAIRGQLWLRDDLAGGRLRVDFGSFVDEHEPSVEVAGFLVPRPLPIAGGVVVAIARSGHPLQRVDEALRLAYADACELLARRLVDGRVPEARRDLAIAHLVYAITTRLWQPKDEAAKLDVPCFHPRPRSLGDVAEVLLHESHAVPVRDASEKKQLPRKLMALLLDGSRTAGQIELALGPRARRAAPTPIVTDAGVEAEHEGHDSRALTPEDAEAFMRGLMEMSDAVAAAGGTTPTSSAQSGTKSGGESGGRSGAEPKDEPSAVRAKLDELRQRARPEPPAAKPHALDPLGDHLLAMLGALGLPERIVRARFDDRYRGLARYEAATSELVLGGKHPALIALQAARLAKTGDAERGVRVLVAHVVGVLDRACAHVTEATQMGTYARLMSAE